MSGLMGGYEIDIDDIRDHAKHVRPLGEELGAAADKGRATVMDAEAFGLLCAHVGIKALSHADAVRRTIERCGAVVDELPGALAEMSIAYEDVDAEVSRVLRELASGL
ncbi:hypothetical protein [Cellulomonas composti]|uniref:ESX-1 secretion-associated protein n=1 Tax=Cellulomonas composti TaxID=266130 RepID=A0A511JAH7_9CELL|nr:hypothetical protein [Cellulomonas composti]GEL95000.1 hypothetical protein CCO02nite_16580 [Cellulomonas composti]